MRVAFVFFEGLPATVIDSQVLRHAHIMHERHGVEFEIISFACNQELYDQSQRRVLELSAAPGISVTLLRGVRPAMPGSIVVNSRRILRALENLQEPVDLIHARTDYSCCCSRFAAEQAGLPLLWDCRGDSEAEFLYRVGAQGWMTPLIKMRAGIIRRAFEAAARQCDGAAFVSKPLQDTARPCLNTEISDVLACLADEELFFYDEALRNSMRRSLGFDEQTRVFVFSGSLHAYQCAEQTVVLFKAILQADVRSHLLFLTPDARGAERLLGDLPVDSVTVQSAQLPKMNGYLNCADAAFMLRASMRLNEVASPTKFGEFLLTGLPVIMTDAVVDSFRLAERLGANLTTEPAAIHANMFSRNRTHLAQEAIAVTGRRHASQRFMRLYAQTIERVRSRRKCMGPVNTR